MHCQSDCKEHVAPHQMYNRAPSEGIRYRITELIRCSPGTPSHGGKPSSATMVALPINQKRISTIDLQRRFQGWSRQDAISRWQAERCHHGGPSLKPETIEQSRKMARNVYAELRYRIENPKDQGVFMASHRRLGPWSLQRDVD